MGDVVTGVVDRGEEDEYRFSFDPSSMAVETVEFQIVKKTSKLTLDA